MFSFAPQCVLTCMMVVVVKAIMMMVMTMMNNGERHELTRWIFDEYFDNDVGGAVGNDGVDNEEYGGAVGNGDDDDEGYL